jgi:hypothetical protein
MKICAFCKQRTTCPGTFYDKDTNTCFTRFQQFKLSFHGRKEGMNDKKDNTLAVTFGSISKAESAIMKDFIDINSGVNGDLLLIEITVINPETLKKDEPSLFEESDETENKTPTDTTTQEGTATEKTDPGVELGILTEEK